MSNLPERTKKYKEGLTDMIDYIDHITPVRLLTIVEVGCWTGVASVMFAKRFKKVICIDPWAKNPNNELACKYDMEKVEKIFDERTKPFVKESILQKYKSTSMEVVELFEENNIKPFDVVYLDAMHDYENVLADNIAWKSFAKIFICGHDYEHRFKGVVKAVNKIFGYPQKVFKDTSWIVKIS